MTLDLALLGFGNVARRFVRLLAERREALREAHDLGWRVVGIATRRHGAARDAKGLNALALAEAVDAGGRVGTEETSGTDFVHSVAGDWQRGGSGNPLVVVETTVLDVRSGQPAIDHVRTAFDAGAHVVSANKGPVAFAFDELSRLARRAHRHFLFEGAVMDGIPVFNLVDRTLPVVGITGFHGVVNSTTNYIISAMEEGRDFTDALAEMQKAGIAEADASLDVDGWDAAAKAAALANVLLRAGITPHDVDRTGIGGLDAKDVRGAVARGTRIKLVARGTRGAAGVQVTVAPEELSQGSLLANLRGQQNAIVLETELLEEIAVVQLGGGLTQTAYGLLSDLVALGDRLRALP